MQSTLAQHVAAEIRAELARQRRTQADLAARLGKSQATVARRLGGAAPFDIDELEVISQWLGVDVRDLLGARVA